MAQPFHQLLAKSLLRAKKIANKQIINSAQLARLDRERLIRAGYLQKIVRGWYLFCTPNTVPGDSTAWYANFWDFVRLYLRSRFDNNYCLSPEASLDLQLGKNYIPQQIIVIAKAGGTTRLLLPHNTALLIYQENQKFPDEIDKLKGLNVYPFEHALCKMSHQYFFRNPQEAEIALRILKSPERILHFLLQEGMTQAAGRIVGALQYLHNKQLADTILDTMQAAGYKIIPNNPLNTKPFLSTKGVLESPYSARIESLWAKTRATVIKLFPKPAPINIRAQLFANIDTIYAQDAYHSLSIEGYQVSEKLIEKIANGNWHPDRGAEDRQQKDALAAKGYYDAFQKVKKTIKEMIKSDMPIHVLRQQYSNWYLALFSSCVNAGIIPATQLAGFRNQPVYIRNAMHVPPPFNAVRDCMTALFKCLEHEENAAVRAVLAHWLIGFIHPYVDGNGRMARFIMNALLVSHGYPWTIIHAENRSVYLNALEIASIRGDITDFCRLIIKEMNF